MEENKEIEEFELLDADVVKNIKSSAFDEQHVNWRLVVSLCNAYEALRNEYLWMKRNKEQR